MRAKVAKSMRRFAAKQGSRMPEHQQVSVEFKVYKELKKAYKTRKGVA